MRNFEVVVNLELENDFMDSQSELDIMHTPFIYPFPNGNPTLHFKLLFRITTDSLTTTDHKK